MPHEDTAKRDSAAPKPEFLTAEEVSARLRMPLSTVYYLAKSGVLRAVQLGRSWRFPVGDIDDLAGRKAETPRILVVDDDVVTRTLVVELLKSRGCLPAEACNVDEGLIATRRQRFDLLLIDFKMPGQDGTELIREVAGEYSLSQMVVITAFPELTQMDELFNLGALTLLRKPIEADQLIECVERILGTRLPNTDSSVGEPAE
jgi:excisionase family DNA binding protein